MPLRGQLCNIKGSVGCLQTPWEKKCLKGVRFLASRNGVSSCSLLWTVTYMLANINLREEARRASDVSTGRRAFKRVELYRVQWNCYPNFWQAINLRAFTAGNVIISYFTIPKNYFINYTILFYNTLGILTFILQYNTLK